MTITNRHVGWGILLLPCIFPFIHMLFDAKTPMWVQNWAMISILILIMGIIGVILYILVALFMDEIYFEWNIKLPKRKRKPLSENNDFLKLGTLDQDSEEWRKIYNRLNDKGQWG